MMSTSDAIECSAQPFDLSFHPQRQHLVAAALVDGTVEVHDFSSPPAVGAEDDENDTIVSSIDVHPHLGSKKVSCRTVLFSKDGERIYAGTSAGDVFSLDAERACTLSTKTTTTTTTPPGMMWKLSTGSHGIHVMHQLSPEYGGMLVTGDEQGCVSLWDERSVARQKPVLTWNDNEDYISGLDYHDHTLFASSADCTLTVLDLRKATNDTSKRAESLRRSDDQGDELLSVKVMKHGRKVVCGTQEGVLAVWSWGTWGDISDRFPGHPQSIDALCKVDEDTLLTGSSDGLVRLVQIHPDKLIGVLGDHDGYPIESLAFNSTRSFVGSVSHDQFIRLWDARALHEDGDDDGDETEEEANEKVAGAARLDPSKPAAVGHASDDEWDDDDDDEEDALNGGSDDSDDSSDDSEDEKETANDRRAKRMKTANEKFFEDL